MECATCKPQAADIVCFGIVLFSVASRIDEIHGNLLNQFDWEFQELVACHGRFDYERVSGAYTKQIFQVLL